MQNPSDIRRNSDFFPATALIHRCTTWAQKCPLIAVCSTKTTSFFYGLKHITSTNRIRHLEGIHEWSICIYLRTWVVTKVALKVHHHEDRVDNDKAQYDVGEPLAFRKHTKPPPPHHPSE
jgi:hypothetical protein